MANHDSNFYNNEENDGTNNGTNNTNQEGKKACKLIKEDKKTAEMRIHHENKMATTTNQRQQQLQLSLP